MITASGPLAARRDQPVGIAGAGGRVVRVLVDAGSWVHAGQVLAVIDRSVQAQQAAQLAAQVEAARANAALAQNNYERAVALQGRGFVSKAEIDAKKATRDAAYAQVRVAQAQLGATKAANRPAERRRSGWWPGPRKQRRGRSNRRARIRRPVPHCRGRTDGNARPAVAAGSCAGARRDAGEVTPVGSDTSVRGSVWQVAPMIDPQSRLGEVRIAIPYTTAMRPGGFAEAQHRRRRR